MVPHYVVLEHGHSMITVWSQWIETANRESLLHDTFFYSVFQCSIPNFQVFEFAKQQCTNLSILFYSVHH